MFPKTYMRALRGYKMISSLQYRVEATCRRYHNQTRQLITTPVSLTRLQGGYSKYAVFATMVTAGFMAGMNKSYFASCETNKESTEEKPATEPKTSDKKVEFKGKPEENSPDEDEPTTCTICLINRQGPCRPHWRKFERCMKDNAPKDEDDKDEKAESPSMSEKCDQHMLPWIRCIQKYRNRYTLISNAFFQREMIEEIEKAIEEDEKVLLDSIDLSSIVQIGSDWSNYQGDENESVTGDETSMSSSTHSDRDKSSTEGEAVDDVLVEGVARINMWDKNSEDPIEIAYVKDQDGVLLGYDQFFDFKKSMKERKDVNDDDTIEKKSNVCSIGICNFHVNPETTKSIQIFALYRSKEEALEGSIDADEEGRKRRQILFYSSMMSIGEIPVQTN